MKPYAILPVIFLCATNFAHSEVVVQSSAALTAPEKSTFSLLNSIMDIVSAKVDASSCYELRGQYPLTLFATGVGGQRKQNNMISVQLPVHEVSVAAFVKDNIPEVGSRILTLYMRTSAYNDYDPVRRYQGTYDFNSDDDLLSMISELEFYTDYSYLKTQAYTTGKITSFNRSSVSESDDAYATHVGWGMSRLSNPEYPKEKYWQRFKISRDAGTSGRSVLVRDLLAYMKSCRIKIDMNGHNGTDYIAQDGYITVDLAEPSYPVGVSFE